MDEDIFADVHNAEEQEVQRGFAAGVSDGMVAGILEGRELGMQKGYEIGVELGFYAGCVRTWRALQALEGGGTVVTGTTSTHLTSRPEDTEQGAVSNASTALAALDLEATTSPAQQTTSSSATATSSSGHQGPGTSTPGVQGPDTHVQGVVDGEDGSTGGGLLVPARAEKSLAALEQLLKDFPLSDPQDERLHDLLDKIRGRFKAVASMLGLLHDYMPREADRQPSQTTGAGVGDLSF